MRSILPPEILDAAEDGLPGAVRRLDARALERRRARRAARPRARQRGIIEPAASNGCSPRTPPARADGDAIWSLLNLELWYRTFIDGDGVQTLPQVATAAHALQHSQLAESDA